MKPELSKLAVYGDPADAAAYRLRDFLARSVVTYDFVDPTAPDADVPDDLVGASFDGPVVVLPDGTVIRDASPDVLAHHLGWISVPQRSEYDLSIYGAGPAGLSAAVYAASEGLSVALVERDAIGGQAAWTTRIENYLGFPGGIAGADLTERARQQAVDFGAEILQMREGVNAVFRDGRIVVDLADGSQLIARSNICATGVEYRRLDLPDEHRFLDRGVFYGAGLSETEQCIARDVVVVGGGNSAGQAALHLSATARHVTILIRGPQPAASMSDYLLSRLRAATNIDIRTNSALSALHGDEHVEAVNIKDGTTTSTVETSHVFVLIGGQPNTDWADGTGIIRDPAGYLLTGSDLPAGNNIEHWNLPRDPYLLETSVPGSFAAGDVRHGSTKRVASAVGEGAIAVHLVHRWLAESD